MLDIAQNPNSEFEIFELKDLSELQLGDILFVHNSEHQHVGIYIGNGEQIDAGGPTGTREPNQANVSSMYTHYIRYTGADLNVGNINLDGIGTATPENMSKLLQQAAIMSNDKYWKYGKSSSDPDPTKNPTVCKTLDELNSQIVIDGPSFISSLYNIFLGINPGSTTSDMKTVANAKNSGFKMYELNDTTQLMPGDILWREEHVGLYVGNELQIDASGPEKANEPNKAHLPTGKYKYTHYIRYEDVDLSEVEEPDLEVSSDPDKQKGIIYPTKTMKERVETYKEYGNGKGYSYDDMYFAYYQIESRLKTITNPNASGSSNSFGGFAWPVEITDKNPGTKVINCFYGYTPAYGEEHTGIDISTGNVLEKVGSLSKGANVVAAHDGTITRASAPPSSDADGYTYVNIKTTDGAYTTQYGHLSEIYVNTGDTVKKGQVIGRMGTTGRSTGVHLHFTVTDSSGGSYLDPLTFYNIAEESEPGEIVNIADIDLNSITNIPTGYIFHSSKAVGEILPVIFIGDSRFVGMQKATSSSADEIYIAKVGAGYSYLTTVTTQLESLLNENPKVNVVINLGVNDCATGDGNVNAYISKYKELIKEYSQTNFFFVSVNPVEERSSHYAKNSAIENFNKKLKESFGDNYIDTNTYLKEKGFTTNDGLHYDNETYKRIYNYITDRLPRGAGGMDVLKEYIRGWENANGAPMSSDGTKYIIHDDGYGHPTVGYGVDIFNGGFAHLFNAAGYPTYIGGAVPVEFVDALEEEEISKYFEIVQTATAGINLTEYQLHAMVSRSYNCGTGSLTSSGNNAGALGIRGGKNFVQAYKAYWSSADDLYGATTANYNHPLYTTYMAKPNTSEGKIAPGLVTRRKKEWLLFQTGTYDNKY